MNPSVESLMTYAKSVEGEPLLTPSRKRPFRVVAIGNDLEFTPGSSNTPRLVNCDQVAAVLKKFARTGSFQASEYASLSFNASYVLGLVKHWQAGNRGV